MGVREQSIEKIITDNFKTIIAMIVLFIFPLKITKERIDSIYFWRSLSGHSR